MVVANYGAPKCNEKKKIIIIHVYGNLYHDISQ